MLDALDQFIPLANGQANFLKGQINLINNLLGYVAYEPRDGYVIFTEDITATKNIQFVDMQLVVMDAGKYSNYDILPLPADIAAKVVTDCFTILKGQLPPDKRVDSVAEENFKR